jgi:protein required for attachment to host cells
MTKPVKILFIIADGGRARWVRRKPGGGDFETVREITAEHLQKGGPQGAVFEGSSSARFSIEEKASAVRAHEARFPEAVAGEINAEAPSSQDEHLAIVAPARVLGTIKERLSGPARERLCGSLAKDLTRTPDHELAKWLTSLEVI